MSELGAKFLIYGPQDKLKLTTRFWVETEIENILKRAKEDFPSVYLYSGLDMGVCLIGAKTAQKLEIPVVGCIPYEEFTHKFPPSELAVYRQIRKKLHSTKIIGRTPSYALYRKRTLYLVHQTNMLIIQNLETHHFKMQLKL